MRKFLDDIEAQYPDLLKDEPAKEEVKTGPTKIIVKQKVPVYVLPMMMVIIMMGIYLSLIHIKSNLNHCNHNHCFTHLEETVNQLKYTTALHDDRIRLLAILHNDHLASVRRHCRLNGLLINRDWTIDHLPSHLNLTHADKQSMQKYLKDVNRYRPIEHHNYKPNHSTHNVCPHCGRNFGTK